MLLQYLLANSKDLDEKDYCYYRKSYDCPRITCSICDKNGHGCTDCPWHLQGVPPGAKLKPSLKMVCRCCKDRMCYLYSSFKKPSVGGCASLRFCVTCRSYGDHKQPMCPKVFKDAVCHDTDFDPLKHDSFYVFSLPKGVTELGLYCHFNFGSRPFIENVVVHHVEKTDECFGFLQYYDPAKAAKAFEWGNGTGSLFGKKDVVKVKITCLPCEILAA